MVWHCGALEGLDIFFEISYSVTVKESNFNKYLSCVGFCIQRVSTSTDIQIFNPTDIHLEVKF